MRNRWFNERSAVADKEGKQAVSLLDGMEIVVSINPHSPTRATIASCEEIAHPLHLFIFSILYFSNTIFHIIFLNAQAKREQMAKRNAEKREVFWREKQN